MSISWINISIKKQHNTTRVITLQTRTTHALSTTTPETGGFLHKKLTATEETGADTRTKNASGKDKPTGGHEDSDKTSLRGSSSSDPRTAQVTRQSREEETGAETDRTDFEVLVQQEPEQSESRTALPSRSTKERAASGTRQLHSSIWKDKRLLSSAKACSCGQLVLAHELRIRLAD
jgi:hypothetical protein